MRRFPIGIQDFSELRSGGYIYVDKTRQMYGLANSGKYYFLSRPRRFGKSLMLSTLKYFFQGRRDLFKRLWVDLETEHDWGEHPVLHFSFSSLSYKDLGLELALHQAINIQAEQYGISLTRKGLGQRFQELIQALGTGPRKVLLLIDEYDKPLTDYFEDLPQAQAQREVMKNFFSVLKDSDPYLRFFLITGVSKFSKVSLFSDLNHLEDLTLNRYAATLTGYTQAELERDFSEEIDLLAEEYAISREEMLARIRRWYNGYRWWGQETLYNPFSILNLVKSRMFRNFWWETGTPTFLLKALKREFKYDLREIRVGSSLIESYTLENLDWRSLLFQTGYLTVMAYEPELELYTLGFPNHEVKSAMFQHLLATFRYGQATETQGIYAALKVALDDGDLPAAMRQIDLLFARIPHQIFIEKQEAFFHAILHITFQGVGLLTQSEVSTAQGRVGCVVHSRSGIYVMDFKLDAPVETAMAQIRDKRYGDAFLNQNQPVYAVGVSFASETRTVAGWEVEAYA
ncbi:MAG: AAA family ATPase [Bacteroidetes bacterium]|nr:MAG: AAA family ATPase [Bacteroidota bacterium]